jgi:hypothetical protein
MVKELKSDCTKNRYRTMFTLYVKYQDSEATRMEELKIFCQPLLQIYLTHTGTTK